MTDQDIEALEAKIPALAAEATHDAYKKALASGFGVCVAIGDAIYEVFPNGTRNLIKKIKPDIPAVIGQKYTIA